MFKTLGLHRKRKAEADAAAAAAPKKRLKKDTKLLSFGEDEEGPDGTDGPAQPDARANGHHGGIRSAHDVRTSIHLHSANIISCNPACPAKTLLPCFRTGTLSAAFRWCIASWRSVATVVDLEPRLAVTF